MAGSQQYSSIRNKGSDPVGTAMFIGLRAVDVAIQYALLREGWGGELIARLGGYPTALATIAKTGRGTGVFGLPPYYTILLGMGGLAFAKHAHWGAVISEQEMKPGFATAVGVLNFAHTALNTILAIWDKMSAAPRTPLAVAASSTPGALWSSALDGVAPSFWVGIALFTVGLTTEWVAEIQRKSWKKQNPNKPVDQGLFGLATNINYGGYTLWRAGFAMASGGFAWGLFIGAGLFFDFASRAVPEMDEYMKKYGDDWERTKQRVKYRLLPYIY